MAPPATSSVACAASRCSQIKPMTQTACTMSSSTKAVNRSSRRVATANTTPLRPHCLQAALGRRRLLRTHQAVAAHRNPLRQNRRQFFRLRQTCSHHALAQIVKSSLRPSKWRHESGSNYCARPGMIKWLVFGIGEPPLPLPSRSDPSAASSVLLRFCCTEQPTGERNHGKSFETAGSGGEIS